MSTGKVIPDTFQFAFLPDYEDTADDKSMVNKWIPLCILVPLATVVLFEL